MSKRLLFLINVDWFFISHRLPIALKAIEDGYEVHLLCAITGKKQFLEDLGLIVHPFAFTRSGRNIFNEITSFFGLYRQIKRIKPDLVHLVTIKPVLYGGIVTRLANIPSVISAISGLGFLFVKRKGVLNRLLLNGVLFLYRLAMAHPNQRIIFQNPTDRKALMDACGISNNKVRMIRGSGVDLNEYLFHSEVLGTPIVIMASRLLKDKGVFEFVEAARILRSKGINTHFQLVGEPDLGNPASVCAKQFQAWKEEGIIECLGFREDIAELFSQAHLVVLPSYYGEGLPKVLIEAAACGRTVITTDMPGCRDAIEPDVTGILVPARDAIKLAETIEHLINDVALRQQMGSAGRALAEREFSIAKVVSAHVEIYHELEVARYD